MKILHTEASCGWGGQEIRILEESRGLMARSHQITLACPPHARIVQEAKRYGVPVVTMPIEFRTIAGLLQLRGHLAASGYDVVNTHSSADSWLVALACATLRKPPRIVRTRHISAPVANHATNRWLYRQAKRVVTTGERLRQDLISTLGLDHGRVISIPTCIDVERFKPPADKTVAKSAIGLDPNLIHIGIVATLRSWKGHHYLLDAFARLGQPNLRLVIVGDGPQREALIDQAHNANLKDQVTFCGNQVDVLPWLQAIDIFVLPSYANEGVPQALMQAMASGLACVSTPVGSIDELAIDGQTALMAPPRDAAALAKAIEALVCNADRRIQLGQAAREQIVNGFTLGLMLDRMESVFSSASIDGES